MGTACILKYFKFTHKGSLSTTTFVSWLSMRSFAQEKKSQQAP